MEVYRKWEVTAAGGRSYSCVHYFFQMDFESREVQTPIIMIQRVVVWVFFIVKVHLDQIHSFQMAVSLSCFLCIY